MGDFFGNAWSMIILQPILNVLIVVYNVLLHNFGLAIIALTIIIRAILYPLTKAQLKSTKKLQDLQPQLVKLQKKYGKDKQALAQEQMRLYREMGINPAGCALPMLLQMPVWIALYQVIIKVLATTPEDFLSLSKYLYPWPMVTSVVPLNESFLWLNLAVPDPVMVLPILVGASMWVQQKMVTIPTMDPQQDQRNNMMLWMMPMLFAFITLQFPSGLALYWLISNIISIVIQYMVTGWGGLRKQTGTAVVVK